MERAKGQQPLCTRALDLRQQFEIPPNVIDVERNAEQAAAGRVKPVADIECLPGRADTRAVGGKHRMQGFDRQRHVRRTRIAINASISLDFAVLRSGWR